MIAQAHSPAVNVHWRAEVERAWEDLQALLPTIRKRAPEVELAKRIPTESIQDLQKINYFKLVRPEAFGGFGQDYRILAEFNIELAKACASTAWVAGQLASHQWIVALFDLRAQQNVWDDNPGALICASYIPATAAEIADGGYRISGRWSFASGCDNADWSICAALLMSAVEGGAMEPALMLVPASDYAIDRCWNVSGLAGTGSNTLMLDKVWVPQHRVIKLANALEGNSPGSHVYADDERYSVPMLCNIPSCLASVAIGAATGALESYVEDIKARKTHTGGASRMAEFATIQLRAAEASAAVDAAREVLLRDLDRRVSTLRKGGKLTIDDRLASRRGHAFSTSLALHASEILNASTGGHGLDLANPIQRAWRDVNAAARHIGLNWDAVGTMVGQHQLGLTPKGQF